jgi:CheY-like chemotaxis protein
MGSPRVLIVEDDALTALMLSHLITDMGCEVCGMASTGPRGLALADYHRPDLALVDVRLAKGTDGLLAARRMRRELHLAVMIISGSDLADYPDWPAGELPLIRKPFDTAQITAAVRRMLERGPAEVAA